MDAARAHRAGLLAHRSYFSSMDRHLIDQTMAEFEAMGSDHVRLWLADNHRGTSMWAKQKRALATEWLAKFDKASRLQGEAAQAATLETAKSARDAAWESATAARASADESKKANVLATLALIAAVIAIGISVVAIFVK